MEVYIPNYDMTEVAETEICDGTDLDKIVDKKESFIPNDKYEPNFRLVDADTFVKVVLLYQDRKNLMYLCLVTIVI